MPSTVYGLVSGVLLLLSLLEPVLMCVVADVETDKRRSHLHAQHHTGTNTTVH